GGGSVGREGKGAGAGRWATWVGAPMGSWNRVRHRTRRSLSTVASAGTASVVSVSVDATFGVTYTCRDTRPSATSSGLTPDGSGNSMPSVAVPDATSTLPAEIRPEMLPATVRFPLAATVISGLTVPLAWYSPKTRLGGSSPDSTSAGAPS